MAPPVGKPYSSDLLEGPRFDRPVHESRKRLSFVPASERENLQRNAAE